MTGDVLSDARTAARSVAGSAAGNVRMRRATAGALEADLDLSGSYETGFNENDRTGGQWPIPNVVGVVASCAAP